MAMEKSYKNISVNKQYYYNISKLVSKYNGYMRSF